MIRSLIKRYIISNKHDSLSKAILIQKFEELIKLYYIQKSNIIIDKIEKLYGLKKHSIPKPDRKTGMIIKDGNIMKDILKYRTGYRDTVRHLNILFSNIIFIE